MADRTQPEFAMRFDPSRTARWVLLAFAAIAAFFLVTEHEAHAFGALHYLLSAACLLLLYLLIRHEEKQPEHTSDTPAPRLEDR